MLFFFWEIEAWSRPSRADTYPSKDLQLLFDAEADVCLAWFSEWDLPERDESGESDGDDLDWLPVGEADITKEQATQSFWREWRI